MQLQLLEKKQEASDTISFHFKSDTPFEWQAGQFLRYHITEAAADDRGENRFFSIASAPHEGYIQLTTKFAPEKGSTFKKDLQQLPPGASVESFGPSGHFIIDNPQNEFVFIAGGIGITPYRAILMDMDHKGIPIKASLLYANRTSTPLFKAELEELARRHPEFKIYYIVGGGTEQVTDTKLAENIRLIPGLINAETIKTLIPQFTKPIYYISGPEPMVLAFEKMIWDMGIPKEQTKRDYYPGYENY